MSPCCIGEGELGNALDQEIAELVNALEAKRGWFPRSVGEIPDFPCSDFAELSSAFKSNRLHLQRHAYELSSAVFKMLASRSERFWSDAYATSFVAIPIASVVLGYFVSWWFLLALLLIPISMSRGKKLYNRVIFRRAYESESAFCFLYRIGQVSVMTADFDKAYYWTDKPVG